MNFSLGLTQMTAADTRLRVKTPNPNTHQGGMPVLAPKEENPGANTQGAT